MIKKIGIALLSFAIATSTVVSNEAQALPIPMALFREATPRRLPLSIPLESNGRIQQWVKFFVTKDRERFDRFMERGSLYKTLIQDVLTDHGVPPELYYLAMIESGFASHARSRTRAVGIWQFMSPTARLYGLRVDKEVDERLDVIRSTQAAARHLKDLEKEFGSWYLAMAAYNCGIGCVRRAIVRGHSHDFWTLAYRRALPAETINYIPKFQAAMRIARTPEKFGFDTKTIYHFPRLERVNMPPRMQLAQIARKHRVPVATLTALNPHLIAGKTPSGRRSYEVWLPKLSVR